MKPFVMAFDDYHGIEGAIVSPGTKLVQTAFGYYEGSGYGLYWAIVYQGKKPKNKQIKKLLKKAGFIKVEDE